ncbi:hypothetical protein [Humisphaera borealis]|uniref:Uncharacterized protein n=1 Tax=Humisphaera borealis TaxID=2807512 RepID=A0A7M2WQR4_9BACT|nr:hypothetical protein [Humisphaera borealis]QOV87749.1 hypothetical protein IPV69_15815 [Humisphaera borealis]
MIALRIRPIQIALLLLVCVGPFTTGCTKMQERMHARYELGKPFKFRPAEPGGVYEVKWSTTLDGTRYAIEGTKRTVAEGELLGFSLEDNGKLMAIAGESRFPITPVPKDAKFFVWSTQVEKDTQLTKNLKGE